VRSRALALVPLAVVLAWSPGVRAQSDQDKGVATVLFEEAKALLASGKVGEACRKLEESRRLDPLPGTLLNLASCHEREGLTASAMAEFREARAMADRDHRDDRVAFAEEHMKALEPRLSMLVIVVGPDADRPELSVSRDGIVLGRAVWGTRIPVDPGTHVIEASAPGKARRRVEVRVGPDADVQTATLAPLEDEAPPPPPPVVAPPPPPVVAPPPRVEAPPPPAGLSSRRIVALATGAAGVIGLGLGTYFGVTAITKHNDPNAACPGAASNCSAQIDLNNQAGFNADASTVSFAVGLAALGVGAFLWFGDSGVSVSPGVGRLAVSGSF
jgi:hypothetical protein